MRISILAGSIAVSALLAISTVANATPVFFEDFESGSIPSEISGAGFISGTGGYSAHGFGSRLLRNTSGGNPATKTTLTLTGLASHTSIDLNFLLAIIDSWDGSFTSVAPDAFNVHVDGVSIFSETFDMFSAGDQSYAPPSGVAIVERTHLGFHGAFRDSAYNMGLDPVFDGIAHTGSTLTIDFFASGSGWQGGGDESFALDNIEVILNGTTAPTTVSEPGILGLFGLGLAGLAYVRRRRA